MSNKKNAILNIINSLLNVATPIITFPYIARIFDVNEIGLLSLADSVTIIFGVISSGGILVYGFREISKTKNIEEKILLANSLFTFNTILVVFSFVLYFLVIFFVPELLSNSLIYIIYAIGILFNSLNLIWIFQGLNNYKLITKRNVFVKISLIITMFLIIKDRTDFLLWPLIIVVGNTIGNILYILNVNKILGSSLKIISINFIEIFKKVKYIFITSFLIQSIYIIDRFIINTAFGLDVLGYYSVSLKITRTFELFVSAIGIVLVPQIIKSFFGKDLLKLEILLFKFFSIMTTLSFFYVYFLIIFSKDLIILYAGPKYLISSEYLSLMIALPFFQIANSFLVNNLIINTNNDKYYLSYYTVNFFILLFVFLSSSILNNVNDLIYLLYIVNVLWFLINIIYTKKKLKIQLYPLKFIITNLIFLFTSILVYILNKYLISVNTKFILLISVFLFHLLVEKIRYTPTYQLLIQFANTFHGKVLK